MIDYRKPASQLVWDQINRDNPNLPYPVNANNVAILQGPLTTGLQGGRNTRLIINGLPNSSYTGKATVFYDRLNLGIYFRSLRPNVTVPYRATMLKEIVNEVSEATGLKLTVEDFAAPDTVFGAINTTTGSVNIAIATTCPAFTGVVPIQFVRQKPSFVDLYPDTATTAWESPDIYSTVYQLDWTPYGTQMVGVPMGVALSKNSSGMPAFLAALRNWSGIPFTIGSTVNDDPYDLFGYVATRDNNPGVNPEMRGEFNVCIKLTPPAVLLNLRRPFYLHITRKDGKLYLTQEADLLRYAKLAGITTDVTSGPGAGNANKLLLVKTPPTVAANVMLGTPYGGYMMGNIPWTRMMQHAYPTQAMYNLNAAANRMVLTQSNYVTWTFTAQTTGILRNGYQSLDASSTAALTCVQFVYYDTDAAGYKFYNPFSKTAPANWYPPFV